jgi:hypothetical protein
MWVARVLERSDGKWRHWSLSPVVIREKLHLEIIACRSRHRACYWLTHFFYEPVVYISSPHGDQMDFCTMYLVSFPSESTLRNSLPLNR